MTKKNHKGKKHKIVLEIDDIIFPKHCALCDIMLNNNEEIEA